VVALREHAAAPVAPVAEPVEAPTPAAPALVAAPAPVAEPVEAPAPAEQPAEHPVTLLRSSTIPDKTFTKRRFRAGYSAAGVDGFLAAVRTVIAGYERPGMLAAEPALTAADVLNVRFVSTSFRSG
jgi:DivIVA domain-containing protein